MTGDVMTTVCGRAAVVGVVRIWYVCMSPEAAVAITAQRHQNAAAESHACATQGCWSFREGFTYSAPPPGCWVRGSAARRTSARTAGLSCRAGRRWRLSWSASADPARRLCPGWPAANHWQRWRLQRKRNKRKNICSCNVTTYR